MSNKKPITTPCRCETCGRADREEGIIIFEDWGESVYCQLKDAWFPMGYTCYSFQSSAW